MDIKKIATDAENKFRVADAAGDRDFMGESLALLDEIFKVNQAAND